MICAQVQKGENIKANVATREQWGTRVADRRGFFVPFLQLLDGSLRLFQNKKLQKYARDLERSDLPDRGGHGSLCPGGVVWGASTRSHKRKRGNMHWDFALTCASLTSSFKGSDSTAPFHTLPHCP